MAPRFKQIAQRKSVGKKDSRGKSKKTGDSVKSNTIPARMKKLKIIPAKSRKNVEPEPEPIEIKSSLAARTRRGTRSTKTVDFAELKPKPSQKGVKRKLDCCDSTLERLSKKIIQQEEAVEEPELKPKKEIEEEEFGGDKISGFYHRCRPVRFITFCKSLNDDQKSAVRDIGFGGLLFLNFGRCNIHFLKWLCSNFNGTSRMFCIDSYRSFVITEEDVCDALSLPLSDLDIDDRCHADEHLELLNQYQLKYGLSGRVSLSKLSSVCYSLKESGDDFKRLFVLFAINTFLVPPSNQQVKVSFLSKLIDVSSISRLNWCGFVLRTLCRASNLFRKGESVYYPGCCLLLVVLYFHRVKWQGVLAPRTLPLIRHWSQEKVTDRSNMEYEAGFGQGILVTDIYPVSKKVKTVGVDEREPVVNEKEPVGDEKAEGKEDEEKELVGDDGQGEAFLKFYLGKNDLKDSEIKEIANDEENEILLQLKRDLAVVTSYRFGQLLNMKNNDESSNVEQSDSQNIFKQESVLKVMDEIMEKFKKLSNVDKTMPTLHTLAPPFPKNNCILDAPKDDAEGDVKDGKAAAKSVYEEAVFSSYAEDDVAADLGRTNIEDVLQFDGISFLTPVANPKATETELSDAITSGGRNIVSTCKKSSKANNFWAIEQEIGYVSKFIRCHRDVLDSLRQSERELLDYVFSMDLHKKDKYETLFSASLVYVIEREDMISLFPNTSVFCSVLRAWSLIINNYEGSSRTRFCFSIDHSDALAKFLKIVNKFSPKKRVVKAKGRGRGRGREGEDVIEDVADEVDEDVEETAELVDQRAVAEESITKSIMGSWDIFLGRNIRDFRACDMVFFPIYLYEHYILLVVNFVEKKFQYLDNLSKEDDNNDYMKACKFLVAVFRRFAKDQNHPHFEELNNFEIEMVNLPSHARNIRNLDCAIFIMHHMMNFDGFPYRTPDLTKPAIRRALRAQMCCTIILHDVNTVRDMVLEKVYKFYLEKPYLLKDGKCWQNKA